MFDFSAKKTRESVEKSLKLLGVNYIDVVQVSTILFIFYCCKEKIGMKTSILNRSMMWSLLLI